MRKPILEIYLQTFQKGNGTRRFQLGLAERKRESARQIPIPIGIGIGIGVGVLGLANLRGSTVEVRDRICFPENRIMGSSSVISPEDVLESLMNDGTIDALRLKIINQLKANVILSLSLGLCI